MPDLSVQNLLLMDARHVSAEVTLCCGCEEILTVDFTLDGTKGGDVTELNLVDWSSQGGHVFCRSCETKRSKAECGERLKP